MKKSKPHLKYQKNTAEHYQGIIDSDGGCHRPCAYCSLVECCRQMRHNIESKHGYLILKEYYALKVQMAKDKLTELILLGGSND